MPIRTSVILGIASILAIGCRAQVSKFCGDVDGNATCREQYGEERPYCNTCRVDYGGCSDVAPTPLCSADVIIGTTDRATTTGTGSTSLGSDDTSSDTQSESTADPSPDGTSTGAEALVTTETEDSLVECTPDTSGATSEDCPADAPICADGLCLSCTDTPATCTGTGRVCHERWGQCVDCVDDVDCPADSFCGDDYRCGGCTEHAQCPQSACDLSTGECMDGDPVLRITHCDDAPQDADTGVESSAAQTSESAESDGDESTAGDESSTSGVVGLAHRGDADDDTYCSAQEAIDTAVALGGRGTLVLDPGTTSDPHAGFAVTDDKRIAVLGHGEGFMDSNGFEVVYAAGQARVYLSGITFTNAADAAIKCLRGAQVWIDDALVTDNEGTGVRGDACERLVVRRTEVVHNRGDGISARHQSALEMRSSVVACNGDIAAAARGLVVDTSRFDIRRSTVAANRSSVRTSNLLCTSDLRHTGPMGGLIQDSIFVSPGLSSIDCPWAEWNEAVVDDDNIEGDGVSITRAWSQNWFMAPCDMRLRPLDQHPFEGIARWQIGDPRYDMDGVLAAPAPGEVIHAGAHQPPAESR